MMNRENNSLIRGVYEKKKEELLLAMSFSHKATTLGCCPSWENQSWF